MCLTTITKRIKKPTNRIYNGYKVFDKGGKTIFFHIMAGEVVLNQWLTAKGGYIGSPRYQAGFHAYVKRPKEYPANATEYCSVRKVKIKKVHTIGIQNGKKVIVGEQLLVGRLKKAKKAGSK